MGEASLTCFGTEAYLGPCQTSMVELFGEIVNRF